MTENFHFARNLENSEKTRTKKFDLENFKNKLEKELNEIMLEVNLIGEGQAAKVFDLHASFEDEPLCVKVFRPELDRLVPIEQKRRQYLTPKEEFKIQDDLYATGFNTPQPIAYDFSGKHYVFVMEKIIGHTLKEIDRRGAHIINPHWQELEKLGDTLNIQHQIVHRDLHLGNIMLQTNQTIEDARHELSGKLYIIDFGTAKRFYGSRPSEDDYKLTIGNSVIKYIPDDSSIRMLKPRRLGTQEETPFIF